MSRSNDIDVLARTLWGEARGEGITGMMAVASVILNRVNADLGHDGKPDWWGEGIVGVCQKKYQFSCWLDNDPNLPKMRKVTVADKAFSEAYAVATKAVYGTLPDVTNGATHYHEKSWHPDWAKGRQPVATVGSHIFYRLV